MSPKLRIGLASFGICLFLDLLTKYLVETNLRFGDQRTVIEGFFYLTTSAIRERPSA